MKARTIFTIWRKETIDLLRDRKTLLTLLLLPTVLLPLLTLAMGRLVVSLATREMTREVTVAASPETRDRYYSIAHQAFLASDMARLLREWDRPAFSWLPVRLAGGLPENLFTDPSVYANWCREIAVLTRQMAENPTMDLLEKPLPGGADSIAMSDAGEFFDLAIRSVGLVNFVEPDFLVGPERETEWSPPPILREHPRARGIHHGLLTGDIDAYLDIPDAFADLRGDDFARVVLMLVHDSTLPRSQEAATRLRKTIEAGGRELVSQRLANLDMDGRFLDPLIIAEGGNVASQSRQIMAIFGGILPYLILLFAYMGGMYPAADLGAGEKERQTLETLLLSPVPRIDIAVAKYLVILGFSLAAALLGVLSLAGSLFFLLPPPVLTLIGAELGVGQLVAVTLLTIPPAAAFSGIFLAISIYSRSYREAQNYMGPLALLLILPGAAGMLPGIEPSWQLSLVPLVNVSLLCREAVKGSFDMVHYGLTIGSCALLAMICIAFAVWLFRREEVLFRV
ncbi:MAG: ABC transporter permease [Candidatus Sumerlaeia bacterium]|nr:ABC transporter permease [Candidatus Sumerlaeia bacterium]